VCVLVRIQVRDRNSRRLQLADLGRRLSFNLIRSQTTQQGESGEPRDAFAKARSSGAAAIEERARCSVSDEGSAIHQHDVAAHSQSRPRARQFNCFVEGLPVGHQCRRTYNTAFVRLHDGAIHSCSQSKIVSIDDEPAHRDQSSKPAGGSPAREHYFAASGNIQAGRFSEVLIAAP